MNFALSLFAAAGVCFLANAGIFNSKHALLNRLRIAEVQPFRLYEFLSRYRDVLERRLISRKRLRLATSELPEILDLLSVSLAAGDGIYGAISRVAPRAKGVLADSLQETLASLELGGELEVELNRLSKRLPQSQIIEFTSKLSIALRRGTPLSQMLTSLAESARAEHRNHLLKQVGRNETRMLIPLVFLILPVTVMFAVFPSIQLFTIDYI